MTVEQMHEHLDQSIVCFFSDEDVIYEATQIFDALSDYTRFRILAAGAEAGFIRRAFGGLEWLGTVIKVFLERHVSYLTIHHQVHRYCRSSRSITAVDP